MAYLVCGILLFVDALLLFSFGDFRWRGVIVPQWMCWPKLFLAVVFCCLSFRTQRRGKGKLRPYTDEDIKKVEAEMDAMYLKEHGESPQKPKQ